MKPGSSQHTQNSFTFYNTRYKKLFENTNTEISEAQNQMKCSVLVKSVLDSWSDQPAQSVMLPKQVKN